MNATQVLDLLALGRALQEAGRCQGPFASDGQYEVDIQSPAATHYCAAGALHFACWHLGIDQRSREFDKAREIISKVARKFLEARPLETYVKRSLEDSTINCAILANDHGKLTDAEMLSIWDDAAAMVNPK